MTASSDSAGIPPEVLVEHAGFVRRIAFAILRDDADADDAAQDALARGLTAGPGDVGARRSWLAAVVRNVARRMRRGDARRVARDRGASRPEGTPSALSAAERQETLRAVVEAVGALDEPARTVVLLRHYEALPPREIAARLSLPVDTVKKRLQRAHQALRARLEGEGPREGERRRSALAALVGMPSLARPAGPATAAAVAKGAVMATSTKVAVGAVAAAVLVAAAGWAVLRPVQSRGGSGTETATPLAGSEPSSPTLAARPAGEAPAAAPAPAPSVAAPSQTRTPAVWQHIYRGRFAFVLPEGWREAGPPLAPAALEAADTGTWERKTPSGTARWAIVPSGDAVRIAAGLVGATRRALALGERNGTLVRGTTRVADADFLTAVLLPPDFEGWADPLAIVLTGPAADAEALKSVFGWSIEHVTARPQSLAMSDAAGDVPGDVIAVAVFVDARPANGTASLAKHAPETLFGDDGEWTSVLGPPRETPLDAQGRASFEALEAGTYDVTVRGPSAGGHRFTLVIPGRAGKAHPRSVIALGHGEVSGRAFGRDGKAAASATVRFHGGTGAYGIPSLVGETRTDADGRYTLKALPLAYGFLRLILPPLEGTPQAPRDIHLGLTDAQPTQVVDLGNDVAFPMWRGRVLKGDGAVAKGPGRLTFVKLEPKPTGPEWEGAVIRRDGRFEARVAPGRYRVTGDLVYPDAPGRTVSEVEVEIGPEGLERDLSVGSGSLTVRVRRSDAGSVAKIEISVEPLAAENAEKTWSQSTFTNRRGVANFDGLPAGRYRIRGEKVTLKPVGGGTLEAEVQDRPAFVDVEVTGEAPTAPGAGAR